MNTTLRTRVQQAGALAAGLVLSGAASAQAVDHFEDVFDSVSTTFDNLVGQAMPIIITIAVTFIGIKVFKRLSGKF